MSILRALLGGQSGPTYRGMTRDEVIDEDLAPGTEDAVYTEQKEGFQPVDYGIQPEEKKPDWVMMLRKIYGG